MRSKVNNINFLENKRNPSESKKLIQEYGFKTEIRNNSKDPIRIFMLIFLFCINIYDKITKLQIINKLNYHPTNKKTPWMWGRIMLKRMLNRYFKLWKLKKLWNSYIECKCRSKIENWFYSIKFVIFIEVNPFSIFY